MASTAQVFARPRVYMGMKPPGHNPEEQADAVRCVECSTVYLLTDADAVCPSCACPTWVSARIRGPELRPNLGPA